MVYSFGFWPTFQKRYTAYIYRTDAVPTWYVRCFSFLIPEPNIPKKQTFIIKWLIQFET